MHARYAFWNHSRGYSKRERELASRRRIRCEELLVIHHQTEGFHSRRKDTERGTIYQVINSSRLRRPVRRGGNERENEEDEKMGHGSFLQLRREIIEDTKKRTVLEKKIITNGFMLESVNDN